MITFGYKTKFSSIFRALAAIGIGLLMILGTGSATETVVKIIACFLFASGLVSLIHGLVTERQAGTFPLFGVNAAVDIILGLVLFLNPSLVAGFIVSMIGVVLIIFGVLQFIVLMSAMSLLGSGFASLILSIAAVLGGIFLIFKPLSKPSLMAIFAGCFLVLYGAQELLSTWKVNKAVKEYEIRRTQEPAQEASPSQTIPNVPTDAKEVEYEKVDEQ